LIAIDLIVEEILMEMYETLVAARVMIDDDILL